MAHISLNGALPLYVLCKLVMIACYTYQSKPLFMTLSELAALEANSVDHYQTSNLDNDQTTVPSSFFRDRVIEAVAVKCNEGSLEVVMKADLFGHGFPVEPTHLTLGLANTVDLCKPFVSGREEYTIRAPLNECGTMQTLTDEAVVYSNLLLYVPQLHLPGDVLYAMGIAIPVQCEYGRARRYTVSSGAMRPTWRPLVATHANQHSLDFHLRLMTDDWSGERASSVYLLGDMVNIEASVDAASHLPMSLYADMCVASLSPDGNSEPSYAFVDHHGCFTDSRLTGSRSRFLPRVHDEVLRIQLEPFLFLQADRSTIYVTCFLEAVPISKTEPVKKACYFTDRRWKSVDGDNHLCESCERDGQTDSSDKPAVYHSSQKRAVRSKAKDIINELHKTTLGPFVFLPWNIKEPVAA